MGSLCIKSASKYVGEIDPWRNFFNTSVTTTYLMLSKFIPIELSIIGLNCINLTLWARLKFRFRYKMNLYNFKIVVEVPTIHCFFSLLLSFSSMYHISARTHKLGFTCDPPIVLSSLVLPLLFGYFFLDFSNFFIH